MSNHRFPLSGIEVKEGTLHGVAMITARGAHGDAVDLRSVRHALEQVRQSSWSVQEVPQVRRRWMVARFLTTCTWQVSTMRRGLRAPLA